MAHGEGAQGPSEEQMKLINGTIAALATALTLAATAAQACPAHSVALPLPVTAGGPPKESKELLDTPFVKLASITLRGGTVLPDHAAPVAVTIMALSGSGVVKYGAKQEKIGPGAMVLLAPNTVHSVVPDGKGELVVLVHYLKFVAAGAAAEHPHK
jgi:quercetin dioxygenase-like cupin family protein